ncbi:hypothetical protein QR680_003033 [Steinernema hermaphroditum]|uniref:Uncharacterized protein n=1 Tax=Steinernema hermaphroditum TaxID=289476 RepID=A0AA39LJH6_9BILA|nr:hypothetical protein QR680_003033 [Steinernema hermaphroditum]
MTATTFLLLALLLCHSTVKANFYADRPTNLRSILYPTYANRPISGADLYGNYEIPAIGMWSTISGYNNLLNRNLRSTDEQVVLQPAPVPMHAKSAESFLYPYYSGLSKGR